MLNESQDENSIKTKKWIEVRNEKSFFQNILLLRSFSNSGYEKNELYIIITMSVCNILRTSFQL